jgi:macrolide transport system ATP-binding/permease protein
LTHPDFEYIRDHDQVFRSLAASSNQRLSIAADGRTERVWTEIVSGRYFETLGVNAELGRVLDPGDDVAPGGHPVAVISDGLWRRMFSADQQIVGRTVRINTQTFTIVGVAERGFRGSIVSMVVDLFVPLMMQPQVAPPGQLNRREASMLMVLGRLKRGTPLATAAAQTEVLAGQLAAEFPMPEFSSRGTVIPLWRSPFGAQTYLLPAVGLLGAMGVLVLVVVCANLANLVFVRGLSRQTEIAMRLALGASRLRVLRLLFIENVALALPGAAIGLGVSTWLLAMISFNDPGGAAPAATELDLSLDGLVIGFAIGAACVSTLLFGLWPSIRTSRLDLIAVIKQDGSSPATSRARLRGALVAAEIAVALVLLISAGLVVRTVRAMETADVGFDPRDVVSVQLDVKPDGYDDARGRVLYEQLTDSLRRQPGIEAAAVAAYPPLRLVPGGDVRRITIEGHVARDNEDLSFQSNVVGPSYFTTLRIPMRAGREFDERDTEDAPLAAIVNETMARRFWDSPANAIGKRFQSGRGWWTIVGVAADIKYFTVNESPQSFLYAALAQNYRSQMMVHARAVAGSSSLVELGRRTISAHDPTLTLLQVATLTDQVKTGMGIQQLAGLGLTAFGGLAIGLAALGLFGLVSYTVKQSTREIGIRIALGASRTSVVGRFLMHGVRLASIGAVAGMAIAALSTRFMSALLYGVGALDAVTFAGAAAVVIAIASLSAGFAASRAASVQPTVALRQN